MTVKAGKKTVSDRVFFLFTHNHSTQRVHPTGAGAITLTSGAGAWNLSAGFTEIVAANAITEPFDIHWIVVGNPNANAEYEIVLYAVEVEIARVVFERINANLRSFPVPVQMTIQDANTQIQGKMMDSVGGKTATVKLMYHIYSG